VIKISWSAWLRLGLVTLRLTPEQFWALTPAELMLMAGMGNAGYSLSRGGFAELSALYPDEI